MVEFRESPIDVKDERVIFDKKGRPCLFLLTKEEAEHLRLESSSLSPSERKEMKAVARTTLSELKKDLGRNFQPYQDSDLENVHKRIFVIPQAELTIFFKEWSKFGSLAGKLSVPKEMGGFRSPQGLIVVIGDLGESYADRMDSIKSRLIHELIHLVIRLDAPPELAECAAYHYQLKIQKKLSISANLIARLGPKRSKFYDFLIRKYDGDVLQALFNTRAPLPRTSNLIANEFTGKVKRELFPYLQ